MELRVLCARARADAVELKVGTAELLVATAETRERALRAREKSRLQQSRLDAMLRAARDLKRTRIQTALTCPGPPSVIWVPGEHPDTQVLAPSAIASVVFSAAKPGWPAGGRGDRAGDRLICRRS
jgi:hypothetical protein